MRNKGRMLNRVTVSSFCSLYCAEHTLNCKSTFRLKDLSVLQFQGDSFKYHGIVCMITNRNQTCHELCCHQPHETKGPIQTEVTEKFPESKVHLPKVALTVARSGRTLIEWPLVRPLTPAVVLSKYPWEDPRTYYILLWYIGVSVWVNGKCSWWVGGTLNGCLC